MDDSCAFPSLAQVTQEAMQELGRLPLDRLESLDILQPLENYYLVGTYPPLKAMGTVDPTQFLPHATTSCSIYLHVPFCEQRCTFCHFAKEILPAEKRVEAYLDALRADMRITGGLAGNPFAQTVYVGGGTPSYLSARQVTDVFADLRTAVRVSDATEITFELHPALIGVPDYQERLDAITEAGVNRWVFGVQSMEDRILEKLNRGHTAADVYRMLEMLADRGAGNLSVDLIFGLPYQNMENWYATIRSLVRAGVDKFNIFPLMFKQADPISGHYRNHPEIFPGNRDRLLMHFATEAIMRHIGFRRGPLFYYSKADHHSMQQEDKFDSIEDVNLLPFGVSGFGYVGHAQYYNECTIDAYIAAVARGCPPVWRGARLDLEERMRRAVMFQLRSRGVDRREFRQRYGVDPARRFATELAPFVDHGLLSVTDDLLSITDLGAPFTDSIAIKLASQAVVSRIRAANLLISDLKQDPVDRYDYSPIERQPVGAGVRPKRRRGTVSP